MSRAPKSLHPKAHSPAPETESQAQEPEIIWMPPDRAQRVADSPEVKAKLQAGTHRLARVKTYTRFEMQDEKPVPVPVLRLDGSEAIGTFNLWKVPKRERPQCGARCRDGSSCRARVVVKDDGSFHTRCRMHGAASPFATGTAPVKARVASLEELSAKLRKRIIEQETLQGTRVAAFLGTVLTEMETTAELLRSGPEEAKSKRKGARRPPKPKPVQGPVEIMPQDKFLWLLKEGGNFGS